MPETVTINSTQLRKQARDIMEEVKFKGKHFIVENFGRPMVAIISTDEYEYYLEFIAELTSSDSTIRKDPAESSKADEQFGS
jgi:PHD/YefM family antitoxin component YafN of YafNO toxin-antitoxin module